MELAVALLLELLGSVTDDEPMTVSEMTVPEVVPELTLATSEKAPLALDASEAMVQVTVPVPLTAGVVQDQVGGALSDWKVVLAGMASVKTTLVAVEGPLLVSDCV